MAEITFVRTRHVYDSYDVFWLLVELSGFSTIYVDELDVSQEGIYIVAPMNGEWRDHIENQSDRPRNAHLILWNIERPDGSAGSVPSYAKEQRMLLHGKRYYKNRGWIQNNVRYLDEVWVSDRQLALETKHATRFVVLGSDEGLGEPSDSKAFDIVHMSVEIPRRQTIYKEFPVDRIGPNCWPPERDEVLKRSRFALNVHQDNFAFQEPLRFALFAAYGLPIISESIIDSYPWNGEYMIFAIHDDLVKRTREVLNSPYGQWRDMGLRTRELMCYEFQFGKMIKQAVYESVGEKWR